MMEIRARRCRQEQKGKALQRRKQSPEKWAEEEEKLDDTD
jgi:hypothetical protein